MAEAAPESETEKKATWDESIRSLLVALLIALVFRSLVVEPFHIPSGSMKDTLLVGDYLFVTKFSYGYSRYSFPLGYPFFDGRIMASEPKRGDVIVFRPPGQPDADFIKRLIGLPGDTVEMRQGMLFLNGKRVPRIPAGEWLDDDKPEATPIPAVRYLESLPASDGGKPVDHDALDTAMIPPDASGFSPDDTGVYTVPPGHYFLMGDNRDNSADSRYQDGVVRFVPFENLVGKARFILFSIGDGAHFWEVWRWPTAIRWNRFFHDIP